MNMKSFFLLSAALTSVAASAVQVSNVSARQRWPWNNLVDVQFTVSDAPAGEAYVAELSAQYRNGEVKLAAKTLLSEPVVGVGTHTIVWDFGKDCPDFKADDMQMIVSVYPFSDATPVYLVVDVSGGESAAKYPVRYTTAAPVHTVGANDPCKTTEIWLKRVKGGTIAMGGGNSSYSYPAYTCTLNDDYYLGVFALTQAQFENVAKSVKEDHSYFTNVASRATRPADRLTYAVLRDSHYGYPNDKEIPAGTDTFISRMRAKTGLAFDLPTEWQWEYASRAGLTTARYPGAVYRSSENSLPSGGSIAAADRDWGAEYGTSYVDQYAPNGWGFYGMLGSVWEWCVNIPPSIKAGDVLTDPEGPTTATNVRNRTCRGGAWTTAASYCCHYGYRSMDSWNVTGDPKFAMFGGRLCLTLKKPDAAE